MQFQVSTDYAIRIVQYLHIHRTQLPTAKTISQSIGVTYSFFLKIANQLKLHGLVDTVQGRNGGYMLAKPAAEISLYDIYFAIEGELQINRCLKGDQYCSRDAVGDCPVHDYLLVLQNDLIALLSSKYISDFVPAESSIGVGSTS